ncbi:MAG: hypothetical protein IJD21_07555 [Oscillospiraceae bacterium]|nr:hypothetical protein [Oscillospiraceae bacterium]
MKEKLSVLLFALGLTLLLSGCGGGEGPSLPPEGEALPTEETGAPEKAEEPGEDEGPEEERSVPDLPEEALIQQMGAVLTVDGSGYEYYNFKRETADRYTAALNRAAEELGDQCRVFALVAPNSMGICIPPELQSQLNTSDQEKAIDYLYASLDDEIRPVEVYDTLLEGYLGGEYLYFRTDHHWTAQGAYLAYQQFCLQAEREPAGLEEFEEHQFPGFLGSFYASTGNQLMKQTPDTVTAYELLATNTIYITDKDRTDWPYVIVGNVEQTDSAGKYVTFIGGDNPYSWIENPEITDGSSILLVKESYGNAFAPFLAASYQRVYIVDYRYIHQIEDRTLAQLCRDLEVEDLLFLNTISTTRSDKLVERLETFVRGES